MAVTNVIKFYCEDCMTPKPGDFQRMVINLGNPGLRIYNYRHALPNTKDDGTIILHNVSYEELKHNELLEELCHYKTLCSHCKERVKRVQVILKQIPVLRPNEVISICDHCKTSKQICCKRCKHLTTTFLARKIREYEEREYLLKHWIAKIQQLLYSLFEGDVICRNRAITLSESFMAMQRLLTTPFTTRELQIDEFPFGFDTTEMSPEKILKTFSKCLTCNKSFSFQQNKPTVMIESQRREDGKSDHSNEYDINNIDFDREVKHPQRKRKFTNGKYKINSNQEDIKKGEKHRKRMRVDSKKKYDTSKKEIIISDDDESLNLRSVPIKKQKNTNKIKYTTEKKVDVSPETIEKVMRRKNATKPTYNPLTVAQKKIADDNLPTKQDSGKSHKYTGSKQINHDMYINVVSKPSNVKQKLNQVNENKETTEDNRIVHSPRQERMEVNSVKVGNDKNKIDALPKANISDGIEVLFTRKKGQTGKYSSDENKKKREANKANPHDWKNENTHFDDNVNENIIVMSPNDKKLFRENMNIIKALEKNVRKKITSHTEADKQRTLQEIESVSTVNCKVSQMRTEYYIRDNYIVPDAQKDLTPILCDGKIYSFSHHDDALKTSKTSKDTADNIVPEDKNLTEQEIPLNGIISYRLSDIKFIENGWTQLPIQKNYQRLTVYHMIPTDVENDWFFRHKNEKLFYNTGEVLAEVNGSDSGKWFYKNGRIALTFIRRKEFYGYFGKFVIYSEDKFKNVSNKTCLGRVLATFDYLGNGEVYSHDGKLRLEYNQYEGRVVDQELGPTDKWKWHVGCNGQPSEVAYTEQYHFDADIQQLILAHEIVDKSEMIQGNDETDIELKNLSDTQKCAVKLPLRVRLKCCKINKYFTLRLIDQQHIYLTYRHGISSLRVNIGLKVITNEVLGVVNGDISEISKLFVRAKPRVGSEDELKSAKVVASSKYKDGVNKARKR